MRTLRLTGVVENGGPRSTGVPNNPRTSITYQQGSELLIIYTVRYATGGLVDLAGATITLSIRKTPLDSNGLKKVALALLSADGPGVCRFEIDPTDLSKYRYPFGRWTFDVTLDRGDNGGIDKTTPLSAWIIEPSDLP